MNLTTRQSGMTLIGILFILILIGFFSLLTLKILPIYLDHYKVISSLQSLKETPDLARKSTREVRKLLEKRFNINMVEHASNKDIEVFKEDGVVTVSVVYAVEKPLFGNLSVIADFDDQIEVGGH